MTPSSEELLGEPSRDAELAVSETALRAEAASERELIADVRDATAASRNMEADARERAADEAEAALRRVAPPTAQAILDALATNAEERTTSEADRSSHERRASRAAVERSDADEWGLDKREFVADHRQDLADSTEAIADAREHLADLREDILRDLAVAIGLDVAGVASATHPLGGADQRVERDLASRQRNTARAARKAADEDRALNAPSGLAAALVDIARSLIHSDDLEGALDEVVAAAPRVLRGCDVASFSMVNPDAVTTVASTHADAVVLDEAQYRSGEGPCLRAIETDEVVTSRDLAIDDRWPDFRADLDPLPMHSALASPVRDARRGVVIGSLNNYGQLPEAFGSEDTEVVVLLTAHLGAVLTLALDAAAAGRRVIELGHAVQSRDVIGQAKGILMERQRLTAAQAFDVLVRASQRLNRKLVQIAEELASTGAITSEE